MNPCPITYTARGRLSPRNSLLPSSPRACTLYLTPHSPARKHAQVHGFRRPYYRTSGPTHSSLPLTSHCISALNKAGVCTRTPKSSRFSGHSTLPPHTTASGSGLYHRRDNEDTRTAQVCGTYTNLHTHMQASSTWTRPHCPWGLVPRVTPHTTISSFPHTRSTE